MRRTLLTAALAVALWPAAARADEIDVAIATLKASAIELRTSRHEQDDLVRRNETLLKTQTELRASYMRNNAVVEKELAALKPIVDERKRGMAALAADFQRQCNPPASEAAEADCRAKMPGVQAVIDAQQARIEADVKALEVRVAPTRALMKTQAAGLDDVGKTMRLNMARTEELRARTEPAMKRAQAAYAVLVAACKDKTDPQAIKHCPSVGWDGARQSLPPLTILLDNLAAAPNSP